MGICSYHKVTFSTPYLTFPQLASFQWIEGKEDVSVQTKCHCPQLSIVHPERLNLQVRHHDKVTDDMGQPEFLQVPNKLPQLGNKSKGSHLKIWKRTLYMAGHCPALPAQQTLQ